MGDGMLSLSWNNHKATFCHILASLREKERYTDVTLACDGKFYPVHKLVLSTCSEYFENMFEHTPCKHPVIVLKDVKHDEVEALLSYMYAGVVNVAQSDLARLIKAAELLQIKGLAVPDEPPQETEPKKTHAPPWTSRDDRSSPHPKRRRRTDENVAGGGSSQAPASTHTTAPSPASSPRASPFRTDNERSDSARTHSDTYSEHRQSEKVVAERGEVRADAKQRTESHPAASSSPVHAIDETLVKEEILEPDEQTDGSMGDSAMEYPPIGEAQLGSGDLTADHLLPNKFDQPLMSSQSHLGESVAEALAGPSGMQAWLGGDMAGGFLDGFGSSGNGEGRGGGQDMRTLTQPAGHQMAGVGGGEEGPGDKHYTRRHHSPQLHQCPICHRMFKQSSDLKRHIRIHTGEKPFKCPYCEFRSAQSSNVKLHMVSKHSDTGARARKGLEVPGRLPHLPPQGRATTTQLPLYGVGVMPLAHSTRQKESDV